MERLVSKARYWTGWVLSALPALALLTGAPNAWMASSQVVEGTSHLGFSPSLLPVLGTIELVCAVLYLVPRTAVLGAVLMTAYMGGAVASHVRIGEKAWIAPVVLGVLVWLGLGLREPRLEALLPVRKRVEERER